MTDEIFPASDSPSDRAARRRPPPRQVSSMQIVFAAILSIGLLMVINLSGRIARGQQMQMEHDRLQATISVLETQQVDLKRERNYASDPASIEHWAHTEGKLVRDNEILVIPIPAVVTLATFGSTFELRDMQMPETASAGQSISVTLWWNVIGEVTKDYHASLFLLDVNQRSVAGREEAMMANTFLTSTWRAGELYQDTHRVVLPSTLAPGRYLLALRVFWPDDLQPLPVVGEGSTPLGDYYDLGRLVIRASEPEPQTPNWHLWWDLFFDSDPPF